MTDTIFFRLLDGVNRPSRLSGAIEELREGEDATDVYSAEPHSLRQVPGSTFAYWVSEEVRDKFTDLPSLEQSGRLAKLGLNTTSDFRFLRALWEVDLVTSSHHWTPIFKGGGYAPYFLGTSLLIDWQNSGQRLKDYVSSRGDTPSRYVRNESLYFRSGLTFSRRTQKGLAFQPLPGNSIFTEKGPAVFGLSHEDEITLLGVLNSSAFRGLVALQMAFGSYEAGVIQRTPLPKVPSSEGARIGQLALLCTDVKRNLARSDEVSHVFCLSALLQIEATTLQERIARWHDRVFTGEQQLAENQREINNMAFQLYGIEGKDRQAIEGSLSAVESVASPSKDDGTAENEDDEATAILDSGMLVADLFSYAIGCIFGRWDTRIAIDPLLAPKLADPFASLPVCSPGMLVGSDGLPAQKDGIASEEWMRARPDAITPPPDGSVESLTIPDSEYPLAVDWDGIVADDPDNLEDIVSRVREVLGFLWGGSADEIEAEACELLGVKNLRAYFRTPRKFFDFHIKRYSKSRRKAPIYWLLQSPKKNYGLWIYYHRLDPDLLFKALTNYVEPKIRLEEGRLEEYEARRRSAGTGGSEAKKAEKAVDKQEDLLSDLREFRDRLARAANLNLEPDLNDGVVLNIAPLHELVPWNEAASKWKELLAGKYEWSSIGKQLRAKGMVS